MNTAASNENCDGRQPSQKRSVVPSHPTGVSSAVLGFPVPWWAQILLPDRRNLTRRLLAAQVGSNQEVGGQLGRTDESRVYTVSGNGTNVTGLIPGVTSTRAHNFENIEVVTMALTIATI